MLSGWAGSGKDTAAALLIDEMRFIRKAFADALKRDVSNRTGIAIEDLHSSAKDEPLAVRVSAYPMARTPRDVLLEHARIERAKDLDVYAKQVAASIGRGERFVISDWRYRRELEALTTAHPTARFITVRLTRASMIPSADPSEHDLDDFDFDFRIANDGCISDLRDRLRRLL